MAEPSGSDDEAASVGVATPTMISCVRSASDTATTHFDATGIIGAIRSDTHFKLREPITRIREKFWSVMASTESDRQRSKDAIDEPKKRLPGAMWSGTFSRRNGAALLEHSGLLCADLDGLGDRATEVRPKLLSSPHLWALFMSPTGDGLKCVYRVPADAAHHKDSFRAVEDHVRTLCGVQIDEKCSDVGRLCFLSHDPDVFLNENAIELAPTTEAESSARGVATSAACNPRTEIRRKIASDLLEDIDWTQPDRGFCACPGRELHTSRDGAQDCQIYIEDVPALHCFHASCLETCEQVNHELRSRIGKAECGAGKTAGKRDSQGGPPFVLPAIIALADFLAAPLEMPEVIVEALIRKRSLVQFSSSSKSYKTWTMLDLGLSVSQGCRWLGREVAQGRVLYLNFELTPAELQSRLKAIAGSKGTNLETGGFDICNLRGKARDIGEMMPEIIKHCEGKKYSMIIPDPIYSMMGDRNENAANEMASFLNHLSELSEIAEAAVVYTHHFAKGNASVKEQIDRASGSGVFSRHPDGIITMTKHEEDNVFVVEAELRSFPRPAPFTVKWDYPRMEVVDLDPTKLKRKAGPSTKYTVAAIVECLIDGMTTGEWLVAAATKEGISSTMFHEYRRRAEMGGYAEKRDKQWFRIAKVVKFVVAVPEPPVEEALGPRRSATMTA